MFRGIEISGVQTIGDQPRWRVEIFVELGAGPAFLPACFASISFGLFDWAVVVAVALVAVCVGDARAPPRYQLVLLQCSCVCVRCVFLLVPAVFNEASSASRSQIAVLVRSDRTKIIDTTTKASS